MQLPKPQALQTQKAERLEQMSTNRYDGAPDVVYYDILDDYKKMKVLKVDQFSLMPEQAL